MPSVKESLTGNPESFKSKIKDFKPSDAFAKAGDDLKKLESESSAKKDDAQTKVNKISGELRKLGPEVNMGWQEPLADKSKALRDSLLPLVFFGLAYPFYEASYLGSEKRAAFMLGFRH